MNVYETVAILNPTKYEESKLKIKKMCEKFSIGLKIKTDDLGVKKLAYPLREGKFTTGYYIVFTWAGTPENVAELERNMRIDDNVLKFMTIRKDEGDEEAEEYLEPKEADVVSHQESEQEKPDALDVLLGFADYKKEVK